MLHNQNKSKPTVGLTPLIDIVFILLIFFMLVVNFKKYDHLAINMAEQGGTISSKKVKHIMVHLNQGGECSLNNIPLKCAQVIKELNQKPKAPVLIKYDDDAILQDILSLYQNIKKQGFSVDLFLEKSGAGNA